MRRKNIISLMLSFILAIFIIIGISFDLYGSLFLITKYPLISILILIIITLILTITIRYIFNKLDSYKQINKRSKNKFLKIFDSKPLLFSLFVILLFWFIYILAFYPAIMSPDPSFQILQFFGIDNKYSTYSVLLDESVIITNHHPITHTLLLGSCVKFGLTLFNNTNIGLFIYSLIQILILAVTLSYTIKFMKQLNISLKYRLITLIIYALTPVFPFYAMSPVKDVIFGSLIILYIISIYKLITNKDKLKKSSIIKEIILMILITLFRNNGFHIIILSFPFLFFTSKLNLKKYIFIFLTIVIFNFSYNNILLPYFKITPSSIRETLSIPFQQTARYVKYHGEDLSVNEKKAIDKILFYDTLKERYNPLKSDPVKNEFNRYSTKEDLKAYFKAWFQGLKKHPLTYIEATLHNTYGYYYPLKTNWYIYNSYNKTITNYGFDYHFNTLSNLRNILSSFGVLFPYIPLIGLIVNIGFSTWILLFMISYLIYQRKYKEIIYLIPSIIVLLVCLASPVNAYFRYALPTIFAMPTLIAIFTKFIQKKEVIYNEK